VKVIFAGNLNGHVERSNTKYIGIHDGALALVVETLTGQESRRFGIINTRYATTIFK